jgi:cyclopropane fatty-acyl-phospholipid synthase-like methyltransferase
VNPRPKDELIHTLYDSNYFSTPSSIGYGDYFSDEVKRNMVIASKRRLRVLKEAGITTFGKVLEVGCATGEFCHVVHSRGANVTGIDISEAAIAEARSRYERVPFRVGRIDDIDSDAKYEVIFAFELIEHLINPDGFFAKASAILKRKGFLCITTPSFECAECVGFRNWTGFSYSFEHLYFFSGAIIGKYAAKHGMGVVRTLYGGGNGFDHSKAEPSKGRLIIKSMLISLHLLSFLTAVRNSLQTTKDHYQSRKFRHNLFMVLRKNG